MKKTLLSVVSMAGLAAAAAIITVGAVSCGRPSDGNIDPSLRNNNDYTPVDGLAAYGAQCPYGEVGSIKPLRLQMWNCPIGVGTLRLNQDLTPLYFQADCKNRILNIRTLDHKVDTSWYFLPDGEFDVVVDGVVANIKDDGEGSSNCNAPLAIEVSGRVNCGPVGPNEDRATIQFQSVMWAGKRLNTQGTSPLVQPSPTPGLPPPPVSVGPKISNQCKLPSSCYLYTQSEIKQCQ
jgi:hypothetical protein